MKETKIVALESDLKHANKSNEQMEREKAELKTQVDRLQMKVHSVSGMHERLELQLKAQKNNVSIILPSSFQLSVWFGSSAHVQVSEASIYEGRISQLEEHLRHQRIELDALRTEMAEKCSSLDQIKKDKQTLFNGKITMQCLSDSFLRNIYHNDTFPIPFLVDVQDLCKKLSEKDDIIARLESQNKETVHGMEKDYATEKVSLIQEKHRLESDVIKIKSVKNENNVIVFESFLHPRNSALYLVWFLTRKEVETLKDDLHRKEIELEAHQRTKADYDSESKWVTYVSCLEMHFQISTTSALRSVNYV